MQKSIAPLCVYTKWIVFPFILKEKKKKPFRAYTDWYKYKKSINIKNIKKNIYNNILKLHNWNFFFNEKIIDLIDKQVVEILICILVCYYYQKCGSEIHLK